MPLRKEAVTLTDTPEKNAQYFVKGPVASPFPPDGCPRLLYASRVMPDADLPHPRVMHAHQDLAEVVLIVKGEGEFLLGDRKQPVRPGSILIYNPGVVHDEIADPESAMGWYCVAVGGTRLPGLPEHALIPQEAGCLFDAGEDLPGLEALFSLIYRTLGRNLPQGETACQYLTLALLSRVLAIAAQAEPPRLEPPDQLGREIKEYIDAHYAEPLTLQSVADALHISPYYLAHVFRKEIGYTPRQYLTRRRIGEAQTLLLETDLPISRISELVGYETQNHFDMQFTKNVGMPPRRYRQNVIQPPGDGS